MLTAGLLCGLSGGRGGEGRGRGERALSLDFFLRLVRALGRHLAPISVPSPLVRYRSARRRRNARNILVAPLRVASTQLQVVSPCCK